MSISRASRLLQQFDERIFSKEEEDAWRNRQSNSAARERRAELRQNKNWGKTDAEERASDWRRAQQPFGKNK